MVRLGHFRPKNARTHAFPKPPPAPVTTTVWPLNDSVMLQIRRSKTRESGRSETFALASKYLAPLACEIPRSSECTETPVFHAVYPKDK